ncbi:MULTISPECIES: protoporphyrinogen/coproporphyrinogen oxidase [Streptomyces]|uniref:FAD-dependent oxidoreductase n=2 Tax=Streptomyces TaxID=1883 RepID=A0A3R7LIR9_9ACTN|nr:MULTISPECIES: NAD(P)/FAD-dependent oxidoreductase [Streptomyces]PQM19841.1 FAD-dependent oxidoreductase [Streptomyces xinghaiensis]RKM90877.1 FAD-dependent oxidoreductase [Streptomyces xinghaiensis]RNC68807.1 FAD-dependent oxidoreductase [Streptomyces xinghaiensis]
MNATGTKEPIIVIGAGIAGMTAAFRLQQDGHPVRVLEAEDRAGGRMRTVERRGYHMDLAAILLIENYTQMRALVRDLGIEGTTQRTNNVVGIRRGGRIHRMRANRPTDLKRSGLLPWSSLPAMLRLQADLGKYGSRLRWDSDMGEAAALDTETAAAYAERRLDAEFRDWVVDPMSAMFFNSPPDLSVVNFLFSMPAVNAEWFNFHDRVDTLTTALAARLPVETRAEVTQVEEVPDGVRVHWRREGEPEHTEEAAAAVVALPGPVAARLCPGLAPATLDYLANVPYVPDIHVYFGVDRRPDETATCVLFPQREHPDLGVVTFNHNFAPGRAPQGHALLTSYYRYPWAMRHWEADDEKVVELTHEVHRQAWPELARHIEAHQDMAYVQRWKNAVILRKPGDYARLRDFNRGLDPHCRIQLAGDYLAFSATNSSLVTGERAAERVRDIVTTGAVSAGRG